MTDPRHHHYVPQCYLKGFTSSGHKAGSLNVWDLVRTQKFTSKPRGVGAERDFNRIDIEGRDPNDLERAFGQFEHGLADALDRIRASKRFTDDEDLSFILNLAMLILVRHPQRRNWFAGIIARNTTAMMQELISSRERWEAELAKVKGAPITDADVSYETMKAFVEGGMYRIITRPDYLAQIESDTHDKLLPMLANRRWSLLTTTVQDPFITSDNPVQLLWTAPGLPGRPGVQHGVVMFPLSSVITLVGTFEHGPDEVQTISPTAVARFNSLVFANAATQIYSENLNFKYLLSDLRTVRVPGHIFEDWRKRKPPEKNERLWGYTADKDTQNSL